MNKKNEKPPKNLILNDGAHIIIPGSTKGGPGKSSTVITTAAVCRLLEIKYIVASYDQSNTTLERSLGKDVVVTLDAQTLELARSTLAQVTKRARATNALILMDLPGALTNKESVLLENIQNARVINRCESVSLIVPVSPDPEEIEGGVTGIKIFQPDTVMIRARKPSKHAPSFESFGKPWEFLATFPIWECEQWSQTIKEIMTHSGDYGHLPPVPDLANYLASNSGKLMEVEELGIEDVVLHIESAAAAIYEHILKPITTASDPKDSKVKTKEPVTA